MPVCKTTMKLIKTRIKPNKTRCSLDC